MYWPFFSSCAPVDLSNKVVADQFFFRLILNWESNWPYNYTLEKCPLLKSFDGSDLLENYEQYLEALSQSEYIFCGEENDITLPHRSIYKE